MGKASEIRRTIRNLTPEEEDARRGGPRPPLQLRPDVLAAALQPAASIDEVLKQLGGEAVGQVALHDPASGTTAVAIPVERYLQLIGADIADRNLTRIQLDGSMRPSDATLAESGVEQVDPQTPWRQLPGDLVV